MKIAPSISAYMEPEDLDFSSAVNKIKEEGYAHIDLRNLNNFTDEEKKIIIASKLIPVVHLNMDDTNLASRNEGIRKETIRQYQEEIKLTKELGGSLVTLHPGRYRNFTDEEAAYERLSNSLEELIPFAKEHNVEICLENMGREDRRSICKKSENIQELLDKFPSLMLTLDAAHAVKVFNNPIEMYEQFKDRIKVMHISGTSYRKNHVEVSLEESDRDFTSFLKAIKDTQAVIIIENREFSKHQQSVEFIKKSIK